MAHIEHSYYFAELKCSMGQKENKKELAPDAQYAYGLMEEISGITG